MSITPIRVHSDQQVAPADVGSKRLLEEIESKTNNEGIEELVENPQPIESKAVDVPHNLSSPSPDIKDPIEKTAKVVSNLPSSVKENLSKENDSSIYDKFTPSMGAKLKEKGLEYTMGCIETTRAYIAERKEMDRPALEAFESPMKEDVLSKIKTEKLKSIDGGLGGVYFLGKQAQPEYVIKPRDEINGALNNGKKWASTFLKQETEEAPPPTPSLKAETEKTPPPTPDLPTSPSKTEETPPNISLEEDLEVEEENMDHGIDIWDSVENAELAYQTALILNVGFATPQTETIILTHEGFHDILNSDADNVKEKVCTVQKFMPGCTDIGNILTTAAGDREKLDKLKSEAVSQITPADIDHDQYEAVAILAFVTGETDGNAGNLMCTINPLPGQSRSIFKIDNAATFPTHNRGLTPGIEWAVHNYEKEISAKAKNIIKNIDVKAIEQAMTNLGRDDAIPAMQERCEMMNLVLMQEDPSQPLRWDTFTAELMSYF